MGTKRTFANFDEEFEAMEKWVNESEYGKVVKQIKELGSNHFPSWRSDYGFQTNDLELYIGENECGFNGNEKSFADGLMLFLDGYDIICIINNKPSQKYSNDKEIAALVSKLITLA